MTVKKLLPPGTMAVCSVDIDQLILWSSYNCDLDNINATVGVNEVLMVINSRTIPEEERTKYDEVYTDEWKNGAYLILASSGVSGWVGAGWISSMI